MQTEKVTNGESVNSINDLLDKISCAGILADSVYSIFFDIHNELANHHILLDKKINHNYKRLATHTARLRDTLLRLTPQKESEGENVIDVTLALSQIQESIIRQFLNVVLYYIKTADLHSLLELQKYLKELPDKDILSYEDIDIAQLVEALKVEPEKTN